jgi:hypothetical protein
MRRVLVTGGPDPGSSVILWLLAACREVRTMVWSPAHAAAVHGMVDIGDVQPGARVSLVAADRDHGAGRLDAVAGGEFIDDRIRLRE